MEPASKPTAKCEVTRVYEPKSVFADRTVTRGNRYGIFTWIAVEKWGLTPVVEDIRIERIKGVPTDASPSTP